MLTEEDARAPEEPAAGRAVPASHGKAALASEGAAARPREDVRGRATGLDRTLDGSWSLRTLARFTHADQDQDLRGVLALDVEPPEAPWVSGHLLARAEGDLDGAQEGQTFHGLADTYGSSVVAKLHEAYVDLALDRDPAAAPRTVRIGRQTDVELPELVRFDGLWFRSRPRGASAWSLGLYGGVPARLYESRQAGELAYGAFLELEPWSGGRARIDWMHLEDEVLLGEQRDDLLGLTLRQRLDRLGWLEGRWTRLEGENRDLDLRARLQSSTADTTVGLRYHELLEAQEMRALELDPFTEALQEYLPFRQLGLDLARSFGAHLSVELGLDLRRVRESSDVGPFNREWERGTATATLADLGAKGLDLALTAERWNGAGQDTDAIGADLAYDPVGAWSVALGSDYALYDYELLELEERTDVRTWYLRASYELGPRLTLPFRYEYERDDLTSYHLLSLGATWRF